MLSCGGAGPKPAYRPAFFKLADRQQRFPGPCVAGSNPSRPALVSPAKLEKSEIFSSVRYVHYSFLYSHEGREVVKRRGNGEGSIYRRKDGLWVGQYKVHTPNRTKTKDIYSKNRKDTAAKLAKAIADRDSGLVFDSGSLAVGEYLGRRLDSVRRTVRERT